MTCGSWTMKMCTASCKATPIKEQMAQAAREAGKENAARTAPAKKKEARDDR